jgi:site-specific DNA-cytosine methylase
VRPSSAATIVWSTSIVSPSPRCSPASAASSSGLHGAGHRTAAWCEADPGAAAVLRSRFEIGESLHADVADMDELGYDVEWVTAGFPCR